MSLAFMFYLWSLIFTPHHPPVQDHGEAYWIPAYVQPQAQPQAPTLPVQQHFCRVLSPTLSVCA